MADSSYPTVSDSTETSVDTITSPESTDPPMQSQLHPIQHPHQPRPTTATTTTRPRDFLCPAPGCGKRFSKKWNMQAHERLHTGSTPFACRLGCGASYMWMSSRKGHELNRCRFAATVPAALNPSRQPGRRRRKKKPQALSLQSPKTRPSRLHLRHHTDVMLGSAIMSPTGVQQMTAHPSVLGFLDVSCGTPEGYMSSTTASPTVSSDRMSMPGMGAASLPVADPATAAAAAVMAAAPVPASDAAEPAGTTARNRTGTSQTGRRSSTPQMGESQEQEWRHMRQPEWDCESDSPRESVSERVSGSQSTCGGQSWGARTAVTCSDRVAQWVGSHPDGCGGGKWDKRVEQIGIERIGSAFERFQKMGRAGCSLERLECVSNVTEDVATEMDLVQTEEEEQEKGEREEDILADVLLPECSHFSRQFVEQLVFGRESN